MSVVNIIDHRKRPYRWRKVNAVVEATWHDNRVKDSDRSDDGVGPDYAEREHVTVEAALLWASSFNGHVTLYLYDEDSGIYPIPMKRA